MDDKKLSIHFVVVSGGSKGSFSAGFLYRLFTEYKDKFTTYRIDSCSVGSLNGLAVASGNVKNLKKVWYNIKSVNDIFYQYSTVRAVYNLMNYRGAYCNSPLKKIIDKNEIQDENIMNKFNCVVTNIRSGIYEYKNGTDRQIKKFVLASSSCWILVPPEKIDGLTYTDGGLLQNYPISFVENSLADFILIVGYDDEHFSKFNSTDGETIFHFLARLIDITRGNNVNLHNLEYLIQTMPNLILIRNPLKIDFMNFSPDTIRQGFEAGERYADKFFLRYMLNHIKRTKSCDLDSPKNTIIRRNSF